ncbi:MAG: nucleotide exchange factor GrpE [Candidatus Paceibacterota bacterium]|jgi:molecular chaperone GrpE
MEEKQTSKEEKDESIKLKEEKNKYLTDWQKARAELINYKKEEENRLRGVIKFANERIVKELIAVLDSFDLAIQSLENSNDETAKTKYSKGIYLIRNQLEDLMKKEGLNEIKVEKGTIPDLTCEEIISEIETLEFPSGSVVEIFQKGYVFNDKVIRPVRVAVAKQIKN